MAFSERSAQAAAATEILASLEAYGDALHRLVAASDVMELHEEVNRRADRVRLQCASTPDLAVARIKLLLAHVELIHKLWLRRAGKETSASVDACVVEVRNALANLRSATLRLFVQH